MSFECAHTPRQGNNTRIVVAKHFGANTLDPFSQFRAMVKFRHARLRHFRSTLLIVLVYRIVYLCTAQSTSKQGKIRLAQEGAELDIYHNCVLPKTLGISAVRSYQCCHCLSCLFSA